MPPQSLVSIATAIALLIVTSDQLPVATKKWRVASDRKPITHDSLPITNYQPASLLTRLWQGKFQVDTISGGHQRAVYSVAFSPNSQLLASSGGERTIEIWYLGAKRLLQTYIAQRWGEFSSVYA